MSSIVEVIRLGPRCDQTLVSRATFRSHRILRLQAGSALVVRGAVGRAIRGPVWFNPSIARGERIALRITAGSRSFPRSARRSGATTTTAHGFQRAPRLRRRCVDLPQHANVNPGVPDLRIQSSRDSPENECLRAESFQCSTLAQRWACGSEHPRLSSLRCGGSASRAAMMRIAPGESRSSRRVRRSTSCPKRQGSKHDRESPAGEKVDGGACRNQRPASACEF
jgi:hypothetical protein